MIVTALVAVRIEIITYSALAISNRVTALVAVRIEIMFDPKTHIVQDSHRPCGGED